MRGLLETTDCHVIVCGRSLAKAETLIASLRRYGDRLSAARIDRNAAEPLCIKALKAFCIVDAAGPFQNDDLSFARAVICSGTHYVDLADARDFIARFPSLDDIAKSSGVVAVSGASSTPGLSMAVVAHLTDAWQRVDHVEMCILPGGQAALGLSVVRAILSYAGRPVEIRAFGGPRHAFGWGFLSRRRGKDLGLRLQSLVETADLDLVARSYPDVRSVLFFASVEQKILHIGLWILSGFVRAGFVRSLLPFAQVLHASAKVFRPWGTDRGGMVVEAEGVNAEGRRMHAFWTLIAERGDGPTIPALPALCVVQQLLKGHLTSVGAHLCGDVLGLQSIEKQFARFAISTHVSFTALADAPLFARMDSRFFDMPACVQMAHSPSPASVLEGEVQIQRGENVVARLIARCVGFPVGEGSHAARVAIEQKGDGEVWVRKFGESEFRSFLSAGEGPSEIVEQFGPLRFVLDLKPDASGFALTVKRWSIWNMPLPAILAPKTSALASSDSDGRYHFDVEIGWFAAGRLVRYQGTLAPVTLAR